MVLVLIVGALLWAGFRVLRWRFMTYLLTDRRIMMEGGILSRTAGNDSTGPHPEHGDSPPARRPV